MRLNLTAGKVANMAGFLKIRHHRVRVLVGLNVFFSNLALDLHPKGCKTQSVQQGKLGGVIQLGRSKTTRGRTS